MESSLAMQTYQNLIIPIQNKSLDFLLRTLCNPDINTQQFQKVSERLLTILIEEVLAREPMIDKTITSASGSNIVYSTLQWEGKYCCVSILRAGLSMLKVVQNIIPDITAGFILIQRDEQSQNKDPIFYYSKFPKDIASRRVLMLDPMLATGNTVCKAIETVINAGLSQENILFINLFGCPTGVENLAKTYPQVKIVSSSINTNLNSKKYLEPGIGDFGDRYFGTE